MTTSLSKAAKEKDLQKGNYELEKVETKMDIFVCGEKVLGNLCSYIIGESLPSDAMKEEHKGENGKTIEIFSYNYPKKILKSYNHPKKIFKWRFHHFSTKEGLEDNEIDLIHSFIKSYYIKKKENNVLIISSEIVDSNKLTALIRKIYEKFLQGYAELIFMNYINGYFDLYTIDDIDNDNDDDENFCPKYEKHCGCNEDEILEVLFEKCSYFNQLGDSVIFPFPRKASQAEQDIFQDIYGNTFNILVIGERGSGKSTLINKIIGKKKAKTGSGDDITKNIAFYSKDRVTLFDLPGSNGLNDESNYIDLIKKNNKGKYNLHNQIHAIFYTINSRNMRPSYELIRNILESFPKIKLYILLTKAGIKKKKHKIPSDKIKDKLETQLKELNEKEKEISEKYKCLMNSVFTLEFELELKESGLKELLEKVYEDFKNCIIGEEKIKKLDTVDSMIKEIQNSIFFYNVNSFDDLIELRKYYFNIYVSKVGNYYSIKEPKTLEERKELFIRIGKCFGLKEEESKKYYDDSQKDENKYERKLSICYFLWFIPYPWIVSHEIIYAADKSEEFFEKKITKDESSKREFIVSQVEDSNEAINAIDRIKKLVS